jgi:hypothetical protein
MSYKRPKMGNLDAFALAADALAAPASVVETERNAQLAAWERLGGLWPGGDAALDTLVSDIYEARTEGREVDW